MVNGSAFLSGNTIKRIIKIFLKSLMWLAAGVIALILVCALVLRSSRVQMYLTQKVTVYLSHKIKSRVSLGEINIAFPKSIVLSEFYVEDLKKDTLLQIHSLKVSMDLFALFSKHIEINNLEIERLTSHIRRNPHDTAFNYAFIVNAFSSPPNTTVQKSESPPASAWVFSIKRVGLKDIRFTYCDAQNGMNTGVVLGTFSCVLDTFDLARRKIHIGSIDLKNTVASLIQMPAPVSPANNSMEPPFEIGISKIHLAAIKARYMNRADGQAIDLDLGKMNIDIQASNLQTNTYALNRLSLSETHFFYVQNKMEKDTGGIEQKENTDKTNQVQKKVTWFLSLKSLDMENNSFAFEDKNSPIQERGMDFKHLLFSNLRLDCRDMILSPEQASLDLRQMQIKEKCGFDLKQFQTRLSFDSTHLTLDHLDLQTGNSKIGPYLAVKYHSLKSMQDSIGKLYLKADLTNSTIAISDILVFNPSLIQHPLFAKNKNAVLKLESQITGTVDSLSVPKLDVSLGQSTLLKLKGFIRGLPDIQKTYVSMGLVEVHTGKKDLDFLLPEGTLPASIAVPESILLKAHATGYLKNFDAGLELSSSFGSIHSSVKMNPAAGNKEQPYAFDLSLKELDLGKILGQSDNLGPLNMFVSLKGTGLDTNTLKAELHAEIQSAFLNKYKYEHLLVDGRLNKKSFEGNAVAQGKDLAFFFEGKIDLDSRFPKYVFKLDLKQADLTALHFTKKDMKISGVLTSDLQQNPGRNMIGKIEFLNGLIVNNKTNYPIDSILLTSGYTGNLSELKLQSGPLKAELKGEILAAELPACLAHHFRTYFDLHPGQTGVLQARQVFEFKVRLYDPGILADLFLPDLQLILPSEIKGSYNSQTKNLDVNVNIPQLFYADNEIDSLKIHVRSNADNLNYSIGSAKIASARVLIENASLVGNVGGNAIHYQLNTTNNDGSKMLSLGGTLNHPDSLFELVFNPDLVLNNKPWAIDPFNRIRFEKEGAHFSHLNISRDGQYISVNSVNQNPVRELQVKFNNFHLSDVSRIIENKDSLIKGVVDGTFTLKQRGEKTGFSADLTLKNFVLKGSAVGDLAFHADNNESADKFKVRMNLSGNQNELSLEGSYLAGNTDNNLNLILDIPNLNLASLEPFTFSQVSEMSGSLNGKLNISGTTGAPEITGNLIFKNAALNPGIIDSYLRIENANLTFESKKIKFSNFVLKDTLNNPAVINGYVDIHDLYNIAYDVHLKTSNFLALNTTQKDNPLYYGKIYLSSDVALKGDVNHPVLDIKARLNKGSSLTYIKPDDQLTDEESQGIVEFPDTLILPKLRKVHTVSARAVSSEAQGMDLNAKIEIDRNTKLKMLVDPVSGDSLIVRGDATLDFSLDRSNKTSLTGTYSVYSGSYHLTMNEIIKRDFTLSENSRITWSGDATDPYLDLSAVYKVKAAPLDLVEAQAAGMSESQKNSYRTNLNFLVYLKMKGALDKPDISFDIKQQDDQRGALNGSVDARLNEIRDNPNEMNKQVFSLLTLGRFIGEDPLNSSGGGDPYASAARSSASKLLSQQLNKVSGKYVKGVDLSLGLESYDDYSSGQQQGRTQVKVGASKQLFKDKVSVQVGGNVDVEGQKAKENNASELVGNVLVEYKLTEDSRYKLKVFRKNEYENPIEGELVMTGLGILFTKDYNKLNELFRRTRKPKKSGK